MLDYEIDFIAVNIMGMIKDKDKHPNSSCYDMISYWYPEDEGVENYEFGRYCPNYLNDIEESIKLAKKCNITIHPTFDGWKTAWCNASGTHGDITYVGTTNNKQWAKDKSLCRAICVTVLNEYGIKV